MILFFKETTDSCHTQFDTLRKHVNQLCEILESHLLLTYSKAFHDLQPM